MDVYLGLTSLRIYMDVYLRQIYLIILDPTNRTAGDSLAADELLSYGGEVHRFLDDLLVARDRFQVDGSEKWPRVLMSLQLRKQNPVNKQNNTESRISIMKYKNTVRFLYEDILVGVLVMKVQR